MKKQGHEVPAMVNGAEAWQALRQPDAPEMVILDWMMPEMDGPEVVRRVRALGSERPPYILMLTARGEKADIVAGLEAGLTTTCPNPSTSVNSAPASRWVAAWSRCRPHWSKAEKPWRTRLPTIR